MDSDDDQSLTDDDWTDIEDELTEDSDSDDDSDDDDEDSDEEMDSDDGAQPAKKKPKENKAEEESSPPYILPIGMGSVYWDHFGFPVWDDGKFVTRKYVVCTYCHKTLVFNTKVFGKMRAHLQRCSREIYREVAIEGLQTPLKELQMIPNVLLSDEKGEKVYKKSQRDDAKMPNHKDQSLARRERNVQESLFHHAVESLNIEPFKQFGFLQMIAAFGFPGKMPTNKDLREMLPQKYELTKARVIECFKTCTEYSMSVEEWLDHEGDPFLTFSINHLEDGDLKNSVIFTRPKNLEELPMYLESLSNEWGVNKTKVTALISNTDIPFADFWDSEATTQFIPCFLDTLMTAIKEHLFKLPYVSALLERLEFRLWPKCDFQIVMIELEERHENAKKSWDLTKSEIALFDKLILVLSPLKISVETVKFEKPAALISMLWPMLTRLQSEYLKPDVENDDLHMAEMKKVLTDYIMTAYNPVLSFLHIASLLDPRFRLLNLVPESAGNRSKILRFVETIIEEKPVKKGSKSDIVAKTQAEVEYVANFRTEQPSDFMISPLDWWDLPSADQLYPNLKLLARRFNCVPISCVPLKRITAEETYFERKRAEMDYFEVDRLLFLCSNFQGQYE